MFVAYNKEIVDLEFEDPTNVFNAALDSKYHQKRDSNQMTKEYKDLLKRRKELKDQIDQGVLSHFKGSD